jgi:predicted RNA-binding Zn ribbon-like protein
MSDRQGEATRFELVGGEPCFDFTNTASGRPGARTDERLTTYADLADWAELAGVLGAAQAAALRAEAARHPRAADRALARAREVRGVLHALFFAIADTGRASAAQLAAFNELLADTLSRARVAETADGGDAGRTYAWGWVEAREGAARLAADVLDPVVWSAARALVGEERAPLRRCANDGCGWLFVDRSRKHNRRWCDMAECGSRAKARRHYARKRARETREDAAGA